MKTIEEVIKKLNERIGTAKQEYCCCSNELKKYVAVKRNTLTNFKKWIESDEW